MPGRDPRARPVFPDWGAALLELESQLGFHNVLEAHLGRSDWARLRAQRVEGGGGNEVLAALPAGVVVDASALWVRLELEDLESVATRRELFLDLGGRGLGIPRLLAWLERLDSDLPFPFEGRLELLVLDVARGFGLETVRLDLAVMEPRRYGRLVDVRQQSRDIRFLTEELRVRADLEIDLVDGVNEGMWAAAANVLAAGEGFRSRRPKEPLPPQLAARLASTAVRVGERLLNKAPAKARLETLARKDAALPPKDLRARMLSSAAACADYDLQQALAASACHLPGPSVDDAGARARALARAASALIPVHDDAPEAVAGIEAELAEVGAKLVSGHPDWTFDPKVHHAVAGVGPGIVRVLAYGVQMNGQLLEAAQVVLDEDQPPATDAAPS